MADKPRAKAKADEAEAATKPEAVETEATDVAEKTETKRSTKAKMVTLVATRNTQLADGTFVAEGDEVEVTQEYADALKAERDTSFTFAA